MKVIMQNQWRMYIRGKRNKAKPGKVWWCENRENGQRESLRTTSKAEAQSLLAIKNQAHQSASFHLHSARVHLSESKSQGVRRTWQTVMDTIVNAKQGPTKTRWERAVKSESFNHIRGLIVFESGSADLLKVLADKKVSTNVYLRRLHNYALDMSWLLAPIIPKRAWPKVVYREKRAITADEHKKIIEREKNPERRAFYECCWHIGGAQSDIANLAAENIDWENRTVSFHRQKTGQHSKLSLGRELEQVLRSRPATGKLFPYLAGVREADRATEFRQRCVGLGIKGVTLHSYRYRLIAKNYFRKAQTD